MSWLGANPSQLFFCFSAERVPAGPPQLRSSRSLLAAAFAKKILQNWCALILQNAGSDIAPVIQRRHLEKINYAARRAGSRICATENHAPNSCMHQRACAHRAWLLGHVEIAVNQSPIANSCLSLRQRQHFRMRRSVLEQLHLIMGAANNFSCKDNNRADRNLAGVAGFLRLSQCFAHEVFVIWGLDHHSSCSHGPAGRPILRCSGLSFRP